MDFLSPQPFSHKCKFRYIVPNYLKHPDEAPAKAEQLLSKFLFK